MKSPETVADIVFQSFRHSQGDTDTQALILKYAIENTPLPIEYALEPENVASCLDIPRYERFLSGNPVTHMNVAVSNLGGFDSTLETTVRTAIEEVREAMGSEEVVVLLTGVSLPRTIGRLIATREAIKSEEALPYLRMHGFRKLINPAYTYDRSTSDGFNSKITRNLFRLQQGRPSFLLHHGQQAKTTGSVFFDGFYRDMWREIADDYDDEVDPFDVHRQIMGKIAACVTAHEAERLA